MFVSSVTVIVPVLYFLSFFSYYGAMKKNLSTYLSKNVRTPKFNVFATLIYPKYWEMRYSIFNSV